MPTAPNMIDPTSYEHFRYSWTPHIYKNLKKFRNFGKLDFKTEDVLREALKPSRSNFPPLQQFHYNGAHILVNEYESLKRSSPYVSHLNGFLGKFLTKYPADDAVKKRLREMFLNNFADFGLTMAFFDFCIRRGVRILDFEPKHPWHPKKLDAKIQIDKRPIFVEIVSPIESVIQGANPERFVSYKMRHQKLTDFKAPLIIMINTADPRWSGNGLNAGRVSDKMFEPIRQVYTHEFWSNYHALSAVLHKHGPELHIYINRLSHNFLTDKEIKVISNQFFLQKLSKFFR